MARKSRYEKKAAEPTYKYIAGGYVRMSVENTGALDNQEAIIREFVKRNPEICLHRMYADNGLSSFFGERPEFEALIQDAKDKVINCIIVKDLSRFGRDYIETGDYVEQKFPLWGIRFVSILDDYDSDNYQGTIDISLALKNIANAAYSHDLSEKVKSSVRIRQKHGEYISAKLPYGYSKQVNSEKTIYAIDEKAAQVVKQIFSQALDKESAYNIAGKLNAEGIPSPLEHWRQCGNCAGNSSFTLWTRGVVTAILRNRVYIGDLVMGKTQNRFWYRRKAVSVPKDRWLVTKNHHEPIISADDFDKVQAILDARRFQAPLGEYHKTPDDYLKKKLFCGDCGRKMKRRIWAGKAYYICPGYMDAKGICNIKSISAEAIKADIFDTLQLYVERAAEYREVQLAYEQTSAFKMKQQYSINRLDKLRKQRDTLKNRIFDFYTAKQDSGYTNSDFSMFRANVNGRVKLLDAEIVEIEHLLKDYDDNISSDNIWARAFQKHMDSHELSEDMYDELVEQVLRCKDGIKVQVRYASWQYPKY